VDFYAHAAPLGEWMGLLFAVMGVALSGLLAYTFLGLLTRVIVVLDRSEVRPGQPIGVSWTVRAPFRTIEPKARLIGREQCMWSEGRHRMIDLRIFHQRDLSQDAGHDIPRDVPPTIAEGNNRIEWLVHVSALIRGYPALDLEVPIVVRGALASGETAAAPIAPRPPPSQAPVSIHLDDGRATFAPGQTIAGTITWNLDRAPQRATLALLWTSTSVHSDHLEIASTLDVGALPRVVESPSADPYRGAPIHEEAGAPLAASDRRRLRIVAPDAPYTHDGVLFQVEWKLQVRIEPDSLADPVVMDLVIDGRSADPGSSGAPTGARSRKRKKRHRR